MFYLAIPKMSRRSFKLVGFVVLVVFVVFVCFSSDTSVWFNTKPNI